MCRNKFIKFFILSFALLLSLESFVLGCQKSFPYRTVDIVFVGLTQSGKTWFRRMLLGVPFDTIQNLNATTTLDDVALPMISRPMEIGNYKNIVLRMYDTCGMSLKSSDRKQDKNFQKHALNCSKEADITVFVISCDDFIKNGCKVRTNFKKFLSKTDINNRDINKQHYYTSSSAIASTLSYYVQPINCNCSWNNYQNSCNKDFGQIFLGTKIDLFGDNTIARNKFKLVLENLAKDFENEYMFSSVTSQEEDNKECREKFIKLIEKYINSVGYNELKIIYYTAEEFKWR